MVVGMNVLDCVEFEWWRADSYTFHEKGGEMSGFYAPTEDTGFDDFTTLNVKDLYEPDNGEPVHKELMNLDYKKIDACMDFIDKWGLLGTALRWDRIGFPTQDREVGQVSDTLAGVANHSDEFPDFTLASVSVLPAEYDPRTNFPHETLNGGDYFKPFLRCDPSEVPYRSQWPTMKRFTEEQNVDLALFEGWPFYGGYLLQDGVLPPQDSRGNEIKGLDATLSRSPGPEDDLSKASPEAYLSFPYWVMQFQNKFKWLGSMFETGTGPPGDSVKMKKITHSGASLAFQSGGETQLEFYPRTLLDYCLIAAALDGLSTCMNCGDTTEDTKNCSDDCKENFNDRKRYQAKDFLGELEREEPTLARDWETNNDGNPFHPTQLLEGNPLGMDQPRTMNPEEERVAYQWAGDYKDKSRATKKRGNYDLLLDLLLERAAQKDRTK